MSKFGSQKTQKTLKFLPQKIKSLVLPTPPKDSLQKNKSGEGGGGNKWTQTKGQKKTTNKKQKKKPTNKPRNAIPKNL